MVDDGLLAIYSVIKPRKAAAITRNQETRETYLKLNDHIDWRDQLTDYESTWEVLSNTQGNNISRDLLKEKVVQNDLESTIIDMEELLEGIKVTEDYTEDPEFAMRINYKFC